MFIISGCMTIGLGFVVIAHMPDLPLEAWFLNAQERCLVVECIRGNQQGSLATSILEETQFIEAFTDWPQDVAHCAVWARLL